MSEKQSSLPAIVITGASSGIGRACALELDRRGFRVFAGVRSEEAAKNLQAEASPRLTPLQIDVTQQDSIAAAAELVAHAVGENGLAGLVNNAGIAAPGPVELVPIEAWRQQLEINVLGVVAVTQAFLPFLRKARGRIVNISSVSGAISSPYLGAYCASKFAVEAIADALRLEVCRWGIQVSNVEPGPIDTHIWKKSEDMTQSLIGQVPAERFSLYEAEIAQVRDVVARTAAAAAPVETVVRAVVHALTAPRPKTRYYLGWSVWLCFKIARILPDGIRDWLVRKEMGLS